MEVDSEAAPPAELWLTGVEWNGPLLKALLVTNKNLPIANSPRPISARTSWMGMNEVLDMLTVTVYEVRTSRVPRAMS